MFNGKRLDYRAEGKPGVFDQLKDDLPDQNWIFEPVKEDVFRIIPVDDPGYCLTVGKGGSLILLPQEEHDLQLWQVREFFNKKQMDLWNHFMNTNIKAHNLLHQKEQKEAFQRIRDVIRDGEEKLGKNDAMVLFIKTEAVRFIIMTGHFKEANEMINDILHWVEKHDHQVVLTPNKIARLYLFKGEVMYDDPEAASHNFKNAAERALHIIEKEKHNNELDLIFVFWTTNHLPKP